MNARKKGILKGFKYFSHIFDEEEQKEIQIGLPTDVKHVAHIGWDGPSASAPTWMDGFKSANGGYQSAPLESSTSREDEDAKWDSEGKGHKSHASNPIAIDIIANERDLPSLPKASRRHVSMDSITLTESPPKNPTSSKNTARNKDKDSKKEGNRRRKEKSSKQKDASGPSTANEETSSQIAPSIPKKSRRKKVKDPDGMIRSSKATSKRGAKNGSVQESDDGSFKSSAVEALEEE